VIGRLAVAILVAAALVAGAPFVGQIRGAIRAAFPGQYRLIVGSMVAAGAVAAIAAAVRRIRDRRGRRYAAILSAIGGASAYVAAFRTGNPDVDVVEAFHVVEYGLITFLFYRVWRDRGDASAIVVPGLAAVTVGVADEAMQWFVPARVGEIRDVALNAAAIGCGLLFSVGCEPPGSSVKADPLTSRALVGAALLQTLWAVGVFAGVVHLGHRVEIGSVAFLSRYTAAALDAAAADRSARWRVHPPTELRRFSREDQYLAEGAWHIQRRNQAWTDGDIQGAWAENHILERFFAPVLDTPSYVATAVSRWGAEQRTDAERKAGSSGVAAPYVSRANPFPIYAWPRGWFLVGLACVSALLSRWCLYNAPRRSEEEL
jgi:hypothetical protein